MRKKISIGQRISFVGIFILCAGLFCNGFEFISIDVFRVITAIGIITQVVALFFILKRNEF